MTDRVQTFRHLHESGCFVIPNPWDVGSARALVGLGFKALATTSAGFAWSIGKADHVSVEEVLAHLRVMAPSVDVPMNADFEGGFATEPSGVAANVARAAATGIAGLSIEDSTGDSSKPLHDFALAVERIRAARKALDDGGTGVLLTARSEGFVAGRPDLVETIRRLVAYAEAGADCLYAPGIRTGGRRSFRSGEGGRAEAGERARGWQPHRRAACRNGCAAHQRRRSARARGVGRVLRGCQ